MDPVRIGVIGCGDIAPVYLGSLQAFRHVSCIRVADVCPERARKLGRQWEIPRVGDPGQLLADRDVELVLNLTPPRAHYPVALEAVAAGKHVYNEKPLADSPALARQLLAAAERRGVRVGCAPATWMGGTWQTCRELVDAGVLGRPVGASMLWLDRGYESWHPRPHSYYQPGAGPMLDIGPYYLAALVLLFGAVRRVSGFTATAFPERQIGTGRRAGTRFVIGTADHVAGTLELANGVIVTITTSYATWPASVDSVQLFGSEATLVLPPANHLGGPIWIQDSWPASWRRLPVRHGRTDQSRWWAIGVAEMASAMRTGEPHRASGELGLHVLEVLDGLLTSAADGMVRSPGKLPTRPHPLQPAAGPRSRSSSSRKACQGGRVPARPGAS
jgi:predicted dehydrogenase